MNWFFRGLNEPPCFDASEANGDGRIDIGDGIFLIRFVFQAGSTPPAPFPDCGLLENLMGCGSSVCP